MRLLFASRPELLTRALGVVTRALSTSVLRRAGLRVQSGAKTGIVTAIQRFGSNLGVNIHLHMLAPDGAYSFEQERPRFHRVQAPSHEELPRLLDLLIRRITRTLVRAGVRVAEDEQAYLDLAMDSPYEQRVGAAVRDLIAAGPQAGRATLRLHDPSLAAEIRR